MSVNSGLKATKIIGQRKAFYRQRIPEFSCARKETVFEGIKSKQKNWNWHDLSKRKQTLNYNAVTIYNKNSWKSRKLHS